MRFPGKHALKKAKSVFSCNKVIGHEFFGYSFKKLQRNYVKNKIFVTHSSISLENYYFRHTASVVYARKRMSLMKGILKSSVGRDRIQACVVKQLSFFVRHICYRWKR